MYGLTSKVVNVIASDYKQNEGSLLILAKI